MKDDLTTGMMNFTRTIPPRNVPQMTSNKQVESARSSTALALQT